MWTVPAGNLLTRQTVAFARMYLTVHATFKTLDSLLVLFAISYTDITCLGLDYHSINH